MSATAKLLSKRTHETPRRVVYDDGFSAHAGFIYRVRYVDVALLVLR
jgi:hypothetical protein